MTTLQATEQTIDIGQMIVTTPNIRSGRPRIAGTGVTVQSIVGLFKLGLSPEEIADEFGHLSLAQVYAGLTYYHANREQLETAIASDQLEAERLEKKQASPTLASSSLRSNAIRWVTRCGGSSS